MKPAGGRVSANVAWRQDYNDWGGTTGRAC